MLLRLLAIAAVGGVMAAEVDRPTAIRMAIDAVVRERNVEPATVQLISAETSEWRDSSLGCAQKGNVYRPELTPGYIVTVGVNAERVVVHVAEGYTVICSSISNSNVTSKPLALAAAKAMALARTHLAARLNVDEAKISVQVAKPTTWPNASLGCPIAGQEYAQVLVPGFIIDLTYGKKRYRYHSDMGTRVLACDQPAAR